MARLIDADALLKKQRFDSELVLVVDVTDIRDAPTVDAVEVVRCRDCKHWKKDVPGCTDFARRCELGGYMIGATGFCLYGERR